MDFPEIVKLNGCENQSPLFSYTKNIKIDVNEIHVIHENAKYFASENIGEYSIQLLYLLVEFLQQSLFAHIS